MDKPSKLNERLTLIANIAVVLGIIFLAIELQQNTNAIRAQTRDSITEKQMSYLELQAATPHLVEAMNGDINTLDPTSRRIVVSHLLAIFREWENSHYQYERGLFSPEEFEPRRTTWRAALTNPDSRQIWLETREWHSPDFRAEIDAIVAEIEN